MKHRIGFVSNSSSTSFVIVNASRGHEPFRPSELKFGGRGQTEFGWGPDTITDVDSRINWAYLLCTYAEGRKRKKLQDRLERVIRQHVGRDQPISWLIDTGYPTPSGMVDGYIDHQSVHDDQYRIFDSDQTMQDFLFGLDSRIQLDNDNH